MNRFLELTLKRNSKKILIDLSEAISIYEKDDGFAEVNGCSVEEPYEEVKNYLMLYTLGGGCSCK